MEKFYETNLVIQSDKIGRIDTVDQPFPCGGRTSHHCQLNAAILTPPTYDNSIPEQLNARTTQREDNSTRGQLNDIETVTFFR